MYLMRKLFGEVLPFRMNHNFRSEPLKGGLAHDSDFFKADYVRLYQTDDGGLEATLIYSGDPPDGLHLPDSGSAVWFWGDLMLQLQIEVPNGFYYSFNVRMLSAPDYFLNQAGRPERHPPSLAEGTSALTYTVEITENDWWSSDERSPGREWHFSMNDLPTLPSLRDSSIHQLNTAPGTYPGVYFTCDLNGSQYDDGLVTYWFSYELESDRDRVNSFRSNRISVILKNQYRFSFGRTDKQELDLREGRRIVNLWEYMLGFCSGTFRTADIIIGYGDAGGWAYAELPRPLARQMPLKFSWFPEEWPMDFATFACRFLTHFQHDYNQHSDDKGVPTHFYSSALPVQQRVGAPIPILDGFLRAAGLELPDDSLNASFATLEAAVKRDLGLPDRKTPSDSAIAGFLRDLNIPPVQSHSGFGSYENTAWRSPDVIRGLKDPPKGAKSWTVEAEYEPRKTPSSVDEDLLKYKIVDVKAWRDKRASHFDAHAGGGTFYDIKNYSQMTLEYLELVILKTVGYTGTYRSRTGMFKESVKQVPWQSSEESKACHTSQTPATSKEDGETVSGK